MQQFKEEMTLVYARIIVWVVKKIASEFETTIDTDNHVRWSSDLNSIMLCEDDELEERALQWARLLYKHIFD